MRELFIYYRIPAASASAALQTVLALQARLRQRHPGLTARLLRRPETTDPQTWMETYAFPLDAGGVTLAIEAEIEAAAMGLAPFIAGARHIEVFEPCAS
ncbi:MAG TPA: DUF4936 family protein [Albitalea sp.]|uniref:DUF4936 family protein n=1 Tax=Piscinibacter sp. TaxID=1903157 RepID=UPI002ED5AD4B